MPRGNGTGPPWGSGPRTGRGSGRVSGQGRGKIRGIRPGMVLTIIGFTGNFKTAVLQNILRHYHNYSKEPVLMFEMEMPRLDIFERALQIEMQIEGNEVEKLFKNNEHRDISEVIKNIQNKLKNYYIVDQPGLNFDEIEKSGERVTITDLWDGLEGIIDKHRINSLVSEMGPRAVNFTL